MGDTTPRNIRFDRTQLAAFQQAAEKAGEDFGAWVNQACEDRLRRQLAGDEGFVGYAGPNGAAWFDRSALREILAAMADEVGLTGPPPPPPRHLAPLGYPDPEAVAYRRPDSPDDPYVDPMPPASYAGAQGAAEADSRDEPVYGGALCTPDPLDEPVYAEPVAGGVSDAEPPPVLPRLRVRVNPVGTAQQYAVFDHRDMIIAQGTAGPGEEPVGFAAEHIREIWGHDQFEIGPM